jgi:hypothetical protein
MIFLFEEYLLLIHNLCPLKHLECSTTMNRTLTVVPWNSQCHFKLRNTFCKMFLFTIFAKFTPRMSFSL